MATELTQEQADRLRGELMLGTELRHGGHWGAFIPPASWKRVGTETVFNKIKAENLELGLFVKMYAPALVGYSKATYDALLEVAHLQTTPLVLAPIAIAQTTLFFPRGEPQGEELFKNFFIIDSEVDVIEDIAEKYRLRVAKIIALVDFPDLNSGFAVDVFDDSVPWEQ